MSAAPTREEVSGIVKDTDAGGPGEENKSCAAEGGTFSSLSDQSNLCVINGNESNNINTSYQSSNNAMLNEHRYEAIDSADKPNDFLLQTLDAIELRVEKMRDTARLVEDEKMKLLSSLNTMMQSEVIDQLTEAEREELGMFIDRLITRCLTVDINIQTVRTQAQEDSLNKVRSLVNDLVETFLSDMEKSRQRLHLYLNSCLDSVDSGPIDERFQGAVLGCAAEDQKEVKRKLQEMCSAVDESEGLITKFQSISFNW